MSKKPIQMTQAVRDYFSAMGKRGGPAAQAKRTPEQRSEIGRNAVLARWARHKKDVPKQTPA